VKEELVKLKKAATTTSSRSSGKTSKHKAMGMAAKETVGRAT